MKRGKKEKALCKNCKNEFERLLIKSRRGFGLFCSGKCYQDWRKINSEDKKVQAKRHQLKHHYGLSDVTFYKMSKEQDSRCAICNNKMPTLFVDHCHSTGKIRGLLCSNCNTGLGLFKDSPDLLKKALDYLNNGGVARLVKAALL